MAVPNETKIFGDFIKSHEVFLKEKNVHSGKKVFYSN